jgi:hypothetical protein
MKTLSGKTIIIADGQPVYKWHYNYKGIQMTYFEPGIGLRREKQIIDFLKLNQLGPVYVMKDNITFDELTNHVTVVESIEQATTLLITDQKFSRLPCLEIIAQLNEFVRNGHHILICLNRTYINIDNSYHDTTLPDNYQLAITTWMKKNIQGTVINLSMEYVEDGSYFTWVIPDQIFYIKP